MLRRTKSCISKPSQALLLLPDKMIVTKQTLQRRKSVEPMKSSSRLSLNDDTQRQIDIIAYNNVLLNEELLRFHGEIMKKQLQPDIAVNSLREYVEYEKLFIRIKQDEIEIKLMKSDLKQTDKEIKLNIIRNLKEGTTI